MASLVRLAPQLLAGSAVAGVGFAFGPDIYRATKKHWVPVLILVALTSCLYGLFVSSVWMARNYRTRLECIGKRLGAFSVFVVCHFVLFSVTFLLVKITFSTSGEKGEAISKTTAPWEIYAGSLVDSSPWSVGFLIQIMIVIGGLILGFTQRRKRRLLWQAEDSNATFVVKHGLELLDDQNMRDSEGNRFELANTFSCINEIEFLAVGQAGKGGYLSYDETGKYTAWSGLVPIR